MAVEPLNDEILFTDLNKHLAGLGMEILGVFEPQARELVAGENGNISTGVMIMSTGAMWSRFSASSQYNDGKPDPLERWSGQALGEIAQRFGAKLVLPFERPYVPFQTWEKRAADLETSPLGLLIHPEYGLWFALRGVLFFPVKVKNQLVHNLIQLPAEKGLTCKSCIDKPCLDACPVDAFSSGNLDVDACYRHLDSDKDPQCMTKGCAARGSCPAGTGHEYCGRQVRFHMAAYRKD